MDRVQISSDALSAYRDAVDSGFGGDCDYGQVIKVYKEPSAVEQRRYSHARMHERQEAGYLRRAGEGF
jgi:hypothetical protein